MVHSSRLPWLKRIAAGSVIACGIAALTAQASADPPPPLPNEAYAACQSKKEGDACTANIHGNGLQGSCVRHPSDNRLVCRPKGPPIVPQAFDACSGKKPGDACSVKIGDKQIDGSCRQGQGQGDRPFCFPNNPPPHH